MNGATAAHARPTASGEQEPVARSWPAWQVPAGALAEWERLTDALLELGDAPACADDPERWWSKAPEDVEWARLCCALCPAREVCLAYALAAGERDGLWGGLTTDERRGLVRDG